MKKILACLVLLTTAVFGQSDLSFVGRPPMEPRLKVNNAILAKVNDNTISVIDVMKKMDLLFLRNYPQMVDSKPARYQFYASSWRHTLSEMVDTELILADAEDKELKITDGEIREEMEERYGPSIIKTLSQLNLSFEDAWKIVKNEMIVQRMNWFYVNSKALQNVSPQKIRQAYQNHCAENPAVETWKYQIISIRPESQEVGETLSQEIYNLVKNREESVGNLMDVLQEQYDSSTVQISKDYEVSSKEASDSHRTILESLEAGEYSQPSSQLSRVDQKMVYRIFFLKDHKKTHPPTFAALSNQLRDKLLQQELQKEGLAYLEKLRRHYGYEKKHLSQMVSNDFEPFTLE